MTPVQEEVVHTIVRLSLQSRLPDLTGGARYFQNEQIVAARAAAGGVPQRLVGFGGAAPSAKIGDHTFYSTAAILATRPRSRRRRPPRSVRPATGSIFFGDK